ncbi:hypothetical protein P8452_14890 [Trifolium repens]|nr:hypothetical protein P8452_14890 [Trifolium repens]
MIVSPPRHHHQTPLFLLNKIHRLISPIHQFDEHCYYYILIGILAIFIATFSTGIDSKCFQLRKGDKAAEEDDAPYGYGFFHFVFATGAMYFAMLLVGWNSHHSLRKLLGTPTEQEWPGDSSLCDWIGMSTQGGSLRAWQGSCPHWHLKEWTFSWSVFLS